MAAVGDAPEPDPQYMAILVEHTDKNIDVGEAALFAICPCLQDAGIVTGDKRCLVGLWAAANEDENCAVLAEVLAGRLYSFEHVLTRILDLFGFDAIRQRLIDGRECDAVLRLALGSGLDANESKLRDGLTSYLNHLRHQTGNLLA